MKIEDIVKNYIEGEQSHNLLSSRLLVELFNYRAEEDDDRVKKRLLKNLILKYSDAERRLAELNQLKNKFLGIAAHDLRNPLTSIRGFSEILLSEDFAGNLTGEQKEFISIINTASEGMLTLVNDLLDVSVIESGKLDLQFTTGSLKKLLEDRIRIGNAVAAKKNIVITSSLAETPDMPFDPNRLTQVIDNLIGNAIKFSPAGSKVHVTAAVEGRMAKVSVQDEGPGIPEQERQKLFGEFQKLSVKPTGGEKSTGLGLSIVKKIVEAHNGAIGVESVVGAGSKFSFEIPLER